MVGVRRSRTGFDRQRTRDDYFSAGFQPYSAKSYVLKVIHSASNFGRKIVSPDRVS
jgi:hypothetical protein